MTEKLWGNVCELVKRFKPPSFCWFGTVEERQVRHPPALEGLNSTYWLIVAEIARKDGAGGDVLWVQRIFDQADQDRSHFHEVALFFLQVQIIFLERRQKCHTGHEKRVLFVYWGFRAKQKKRVRGLCSQTNFSSCVTVNLASFEIWWIFLHYSPSFQCQMRLTWRDIIRNN